MKRLIDKTRKFALQWYNRGLQYLRKNDNDRVFLFRVIALFLWINLFGVFVLAKINPFHLLSPFKFLSPPPEDLRKEIILYYPASIKDLNEKSGSSEKSNIVELRQKTAFDDRYNAANREKLLVENAWAIVQQLSVAPESVRGVKAIKDELLVKHIWNYQGKIIVHLDNALVQASPENSRNIMIQCIRKSLQANLGAFAEVVLLIQ